MLISLRKIVLRTGIRAYGEVGHMKVLDGDVDASDGKFIDNKSMMEESIGDLE